MCVSPVIIKNPNFGLSDKGLGYLKDCTSAYIKVPCGHCLECVRLKQSSWVQRCQMESEYGYPFYCTLTYNNESLPVKEINGYKIRFADRSDFKNMVKMLRKDNAFGRPFRFMAVSELGSKKARPHFHALFFLKKLPEDSPYEFMNLESLGFITVLKYWRRNYGSKRNPDWKPLLTFKQYYIGNKLHGTYDFHYVQPLRDGSQSDVSYYVTKYLFKPSDKTNKLRSAIKLNASSDEEFKKIWNEIKPRCFASLNFGYGLYDFKVKGSTKQSRLDKISSLDSFKVLRSSLDRSLCVKNPYPSFYDLYTGKQLPFARYFQNNGNLFTLYDKISFQDNSDLPVDNVVISKDRDLPELLRSEDKLLKIRSIINSKYQFSDSLFD